MKTLEKVKADIEALIKWINDHGHSNTAANNKRDLARLKFLRNCKDYIETSPSEKCLQDQAARLRAGIFPGQDKLKSDQLDILEYCLY